MMDQRDLDLLFERASIQQEKGQFRSAFRLFLAAAKGGDIGAQLNLGKLCDDGRGVKRNRARALYWYRRAYRRGYGPAANNIGALYREEGKQNQALAWFQRAVELNDIDANLMIAKIYLAQGKQHQAIRCLRVVSAAGRDEICEASIDEARLLLKQLDRGPR